MKYTQVRLHENKISLSWYWEIINYTLILFKFCTTYVGRGTDGGVNWAPCFSFVFIGCGMQHFSPLFPFRVVGSSLVSPCQFFALIKGCRWPHPGFGGGPKCKPRPVEIRCSSDPMWLNLDSTTQLGRVGIVRIPFGHAWAYGVVIMLNIHVASSYCGNSFMYRLRLFINQRVQWWDAPPPHSKNWETLFAGQGSCTKTEPLVVGL